MHSAVYEMERFVGCFGHPRIVSDHHAGHLASADMAAQHLDHLSSAFGVEIGRWFVDKHYPRFVHERARDSDPLSLSPREHRGCVICSGLKTELPEQR